MANRTIHVQLSETEKVAFLIDPLSRPRTRYVKTHRCAAYQDCPLCQVGAGEPCKTPSGESSTKVCVVRRELFYGRVSRETADEQASIAREHRAKHGRLAKTEGTVKRKRGA